MGIKDYFAKLGDAEAAKRFNISERAARSYRTGQRKPMPKTAARIAKLSRGKLTLAAIYE